MKPDLAIVDIKMPGLSSLEVLYEIRKEDKFAKFIMLTFYPSVYYRDPAINAGVDHFFFSKADDFDKLAQVVKELVENSENDKRNKETIS